MKKIFEKLPGSVLLQKPNLIFMIALAVFVIDNVANFFVDVPVFSAFVVLLLPLLWISLYFSEKKHTLLIFFSIIFILASILGNLLHGFNKTNVSDVGFILLFATSYFYYKDHVNELSFNSIHYFLGASALLFIFSFAGINSMSVHNNDKHLNNLELIGISYDSLMNNAKPIEEFEHDLPDDVNVDSLVREKLKKYFPERPEVDTLKNIGIGVMPGIKFKKESLDKVEKGRIYHHGLFRIPHVPAYFFGFLFLLYLLIFSKTRRWPFLLISLALLFLIVFNGVRTFIVAAGISLIIWLFVKRNIWYFAAFVFLMALTIIFRFPLYELTKQTVLSPLTSLLITLIDNPDRLSRVALYSSWWKEVSHFGIFDLLFGKTHYQSQLANLKNLFIPTWYHNDLIAIIFSYGVLSAFAYILFFAGIYFDNKVIIRKNAFVFIFYFSMVLTSIINGFYYYFPIFLLFIFWYMIKLLKSTEEA